MPAQNAQPYAAFRLNLEQQQKRAKGLLKAAKASEPEALRRLQHNPNTPPQPGTLKLAQAQHCIARELRFANWAAMKRHITAMEQSRAALDTDIVLDGDCRTMHIRCGHDIQDTLREAGFHGDFNLHINPYLQGPVTDAPDWLEQRARFIVEGFDEDTALEYDKVLEGCREEEQRLASASRDYERVVLWFEQDRYDQFVLLRCLAWFAEHGAPPNVELVGPNDFPGATRFVGLGQLPPEALRLLWAQRKPLGGEHVRFGYEVWQAFRAPDPRPHAEHVRNGTPLLPDLAAALRRHLQELPAVDNGLSLTQRLLLAALAEQDSMPAGRLIGCVMRDDPLPGLGDTGYLYELRQMAAAGEPPLRLTPAGTPGFWRHDRLEITEYGHAVLAGERDWLDMPVPERWVGGVRIVPGQPNWRWDETRDRVLPPNNNATV